MRDYQRLCWHIVFRMVRNPDDARDLCQETFLRVHRQLHQFRFECPLKSWIGRIAYSIALRHLERRRASPATFLEDEGESAAESVADETSISKRPPAMNNTRRGCAKASTRCRPCLARSSRSITCEELPIREIATITGMSEGTIKSHLFRARAILRDWLRRRGVSEP